MANQSNRQQGDNAPPISENARVTMEQRVKQVLAAIVSRRDEIEAVLPPDIPFDRFHATINQALRTNPDILACTGASIVNACIKSAYDGLRLDGRDAVLVAHNVNVGTKDAPRWEMHAEYFPMVRGLIKKILSSREVLAIDVDVIHENDQYRIIRGTNPEILHEPLVVGNRGKIVAAYSIATLKSGYKTAEVMLRGDLDKVKAEAKTQMVWGKWEGEMDKKSVIRRHEKRLPSGRDMIDVEARELFPQFQPREAPPMLAAPTQRPTRDQFRQLGNDGGEAGTPMDFGDDRREPVEAGRAADRQADAKQAAQQSKPDVSAHLPSTPNEWALWRGEVLGKLENLASIQAVNALRTEHAAAIDAAAADLADEIAGAFSDRSADLYADGAD